MSLVFIPKTTHYVFANIPKSKTPVFLAPCILDKGYSVYAVPDISVHPDNQNKVPWESCHFALPGDVRKR